MIDSKDAAIAGVLRHSLLRGYERLRQAQALGRQFEDAEAVLEMLGDPQVLVLENKSCKCRLKVPLVYVASWLLDGNHRVNHLTHLLNADSQLTLYRRRNKDVQPERTTEGLHDTLVAAIRRYLGQVANGSAEGLFLDLTWAPCQEARCHDEVASENWDAVIEGVTEPHWLLGEAEWSLPRQVRDTNCVVKLTFPLYPSESGARRMITLVLGLAVESDGLSSSPEDFLKKKRAKWVRRLGEVIMAEIPYLHSKLRQRRSGSDALAPPAWLKETERSSLHSAVDDLHRRIADFASRVDAQGWHHPENGLNFLIAFKELDTSYQACLRYRLSLLNLHALGARCATLDQWREEFRKALNVTEGDLRDLFIREGESWSQYLMRCQASIEDLFTSARNLDDAKNKIRRMVEESAYRMRLTPGYHVMNLNHPEIIKSWLTDPRARGFAAYPEKLLVWELTALPSRIYYSQVADAGLALGVCGVNADILNACHDDHELQEIIDQSGPHFRYILCEEEIATLKASLVDGLRKTKERAMLWDSLKGHFRRLAYYYVNNPFDYWTKVVRDDDVDRMRWRSMPNQAYLELENPSGDEVSVLRSIPHISQAGGGRDDFVAKFFEDLDASNNRKNVRDECCVYRLKVGAIPATSLLVLVPERQSREPIRRLIKRFWDVCSAVNEQHEQRARDYSPASGAMLSGYDVFFSYNMVDREEIALIAGQLKAAGFTPWIAEEMPPGETWFEVLEQNIERVKVALLIHGPSGWGKWQVNEKSFLLGRGTDSGCRVIPVLLAGASKPGGFTSNLQWVDYNEEGGNKRLIEGVRAAFQI